MAKCPPTQVQQKIKRTVAEIRVLFRQSKIIRSADLVQALQSQHLSKCFQQGIRVQYLVKLSPKKAMALGHPVANKSRGVYYQLSPTCPAPGTQAAVQLYDSYYSFNTPRPKVSTQKTTVLNLLNKKEIESFHREGKTLTIKLQ